KCVLRVESFRDEGDVGNGLTQREQPWSGVARWCWKGRGVGNQGRRDVALARPDRGDVVAGLGVVGQLVAAGLPADVDHCRVWTEGVDDLVRERAPVERDR